MKPLTEPEIRTAFVNCSKGEARQLFVPRDLAGQPWDDLDFLGWRDPQAPDRAYLVAPASNQPVGITLRCNPQQGNSVGAYFCDDLACSLCTRGKKFTPFSARFPGRLTLDEQIERNVANLSAFLDKVAG